MRIAQLGLLMRAIRVLRGFTLFEMAQRMGLSSFRYFLMEQGWVEVEAIHWLEFCRHLELPVDVVFELGAPRRK